MNRLVGSKRFAAAGTIASAEVAPQLAGDSWPRDFVWGVSTSSYQIEGAVAEDGRGPSIWDTYSHEPGQIANGDTGDVACDHYHRYAEDVALMVALGVQAYRFSVAWPRVLPQGCGAANEAGLAFYDRLIDALLAAGIDPWLCLYHWDLPQALADRGGWTSRDSAVWFADYAALVARRYGDRVKRFATINEPSVFNLFQFALDGHPPGGARAGDLSRAIHHVNLAHGAAVDVLRATLPAASVGAIFNWQPCLPATPADADADAAALFHAYWNATFPDAECLGAYPPAVVRAIDPYIKANDLERICRPLDWLGVNHYSPIYAKADPASLLGFGFGEPPAELPRTGIGWPIVPSAFYDTLLAVHRRYGLPIYVLENGYGDREKPDAAGNVADLGRIEYLQAYTEALRAAIAAGADVRGYFVWSLLDNFEWSAGYASRFGIVRVDYATQQRIPKASFHWYAQLIKKARQKS
jgi:beta-glucosidase